MFILFFLLQYNIQSADTGTGSIPWQRTQLLQRKVFAKIALFKHKHSQLQQSLLKLLLKRERLCKNEYLYKKTNLSRLAQVLCGR